MTNEEITQAIVQQIGRHALTMLGAKDLIATERSVRFRIGANAKRISHVEVRLEPSDLYTVSFTRQRGLSVEHVSEQSNVFCDSLLVVIEQHTGLYTRL